jgi:hypothetical protein
VLEYGSNCWEVAKFGYMPIEPADESGSNCQALAGELGIASWLYKNAEPYAYCSNSYPGACNLYGNYMDYCHANNARRRSSYNGAMEIAARRRTARAFIFCHMDVPTNDVFDS